jgi:hypothetical protein
MNHTALRRSATLKIYYSLHVNYIIKKLLKGNINMKLPETLCEGLDRSKLTQDRVEWLILIDTEQRIPVP